MIRKPTVRLQDCKKMALGERAKNESPSRKIEPPSRLKKSPSQLKISTGKLDNRYTDVVSLQYKVHEQQTINLNY